MLNCSIVNLQQTHYTVKAKMPIRPHSQALFHALDLDGPEYSNVDEDIMKRFKELSGQYPTAFVLPGNPLGAVKGFEHRIDTSDGPPICRTP